MTADPYDTKALATSTDQAELDPLVAPRVTLPKNLQVILARLSDGELFSLRTHVETEIRRRAPPKSRAVAKASTGPKQEKTETVPIAKRSLILASSRAGMKPQAIAKTLRLSLSLVNRVLAEQVKSR
jgi:hypothetical protein